MAIILAKLILGGKAITCANLITIMINMLETELIFTCGLPQSIQSNFPVNQRALETANSAILLRACVNSLAGSSSSALQA